tara:strand:+ start:67308 stop:67997 length:690 start_codon:yes stop_codon:yes gene_type:complete
MEFYNMTAQEIISLKKATVEENELNITSNVTRTVEAESNIPVSMVPGSSNSTLVSPVSFDRTIEFGSEEAFAEIEPVALVSESLEIPVVETMTTEVIADEPVIAFRTEAVSEEVSTLGSEEELEADEALVELELAEALAEEVAAIELSESEEVVAAHEIVESPAINVTLARDVLLEADSIPGLDIESDDVTVSPDVSSSDSFADYVWSFFHNPFASETVDDTVSTDVIV